MCAANEYPLYEHLVDPNLSQVYWSLVSFTYSSGQLRDRLFVVAISLVERKPS